MALSRRSQNKAKQAKHLASYKRAQERKEIVKAEQAAKTAANDALRDRKTFDPLIAKAETKAERNRLIAQRDAKIPYRANKAEANVERIKTKYDHWDKV